MEVCLFIIMLLMIPLVVILAIIADGILRIERILKRREA